MVENTDVPEVWQCPPTQENGRSGDLVPKSSPTAMQDHILVLHSYVRGVLDLFPGAMIS